MKKFEIRITNDECRSRFRAVGFCAKLSQEQYAQLFHFVGSVETRDEMRSLLSMIANEWNVSVEIDDA